MSGATLREAAHTGTFPENGTLLGSVHKKEWSRDFPYLVLDSGTRYCLSVLRADLRLDNLGGTAVA